VLAPALPATAGAALLAHLLPGAKAGLAASAGAAGGGGGGVAATVATKAAIVLVATATIAGTGTVVREVVTAPDQGAKPAVVTPAPRARPVSGPASLRPGAGSGPAGSVGRASDHSQAPVDRNGSPPSQRTKGKAAPGTGAVPAHASQNPAGAKGQANGQAKRQAAASHGRRAVPKAARSHPVHPGAGRPTTATASKAKATHPEHPATPATPATHATAQDPGQPADTTPPGNSGAHAAK
jgi:hypothetical protein